MKVFEDYESNIRGYCRAYPTVFKSASNARQFDENGKSYIDFFCGAGVLNFGHNNPHMKKALHDFLEADGIAHSLDMYTTAKQRFLEKFVETILKPRSMNYKMQFTGPTGTNAVEAALKLARRVTGRTEVVAFNHGFHGMTIGALSLTANSYFRNAAGVPLTHVTRFPFGCEKTCKGCEQGCGLNSIKELRARYKDSLSGLNPPAAFVVEAIQCEGGVMVASAEWLQEVQSLARELGAFFIIDDIQAGIGRTGSFFSFDGMGLDPDIINLAKGLGGFGTPIAMNLIKPEHDAHWQPSEHTGTFRGQGFSFVAGEVGLDYFTDDSFLDSVKEKGDKVKQALDYIADEHPKADVDVRGKGMVQGLDVREGAVAKSILTECFENGLLVGACGANGSVLKLMPPLTTPDTDLDEGLTIFKEAAKKHLS